MAPPISAVKFETLIDIDVQVKSFEVSHHTDLIHIFILLWIGKHFQVKYIPGLEDEIDPPTSRPRLVLLSVVSWPKDSSDRDCR